MSRFNQSVVGIFSRDDPPHYQWLMDVVQSVQGVKDVRPVRITNIWSHFENHVPLCSFAILYHSKMRGRVNVTNVTDSLYDEELQYLSQVLGKFWIFIPDTWRLGLSGRWSRSLMWFLWSVQEKIE